MVLQGTDGVVFVADSQETALDANKESLSSLYRNLKVNNIEVDDIPIVFAYNKRDLSNILPVSVLNKELNEKNYPYFETSAITGEGIMDTLGEILKLTINKVRERYKFQSETEREATIIFNAEDLSKVEKKEETPPPPPQAPTPPPIKTKDDFAAHDEPTINMEEIDEIAPLDEYDMELDDSDIEEAKEQLLEEENQKENIINSEREIPSEEANKFQLDDTIIPDSKEEIIKDEDEPIPIDKISELAEEFEKEDESLSDLLPDEESSEPIKIEDKIDSKKEEIGADDIDVKILKTVSLKDGQLIIPLEIKVKDTVKKFEIKLEITPK